MSAHTATATIGPQISRKGLLPLWDGARVAKPWAATALWTPKHGGQRTAPTFWQALSRPRKSGSTAPVYAGIANVAGGTRAGDADRRALRPARCRLSR
jgi:hypothetical protein